jgi:competence protein ComFC
MAAAHPARPGSRRPRWPYLARQLAWATVDLVFTPNCAGCQKPGRRLCAACQSAIGTLGPNVCADCGYPLTAAGACRSGLHPVAPLVGLRSAARFGGPLQQVLHRLKYKRDIILADTLARELADAWRAYALPAWTVMPVPLSANRLRQRGYNQAALLARGLADLAGLPYQANGVARVRHTPTQVGLAAAERRVNVRGAFAAQPARVAGRGYILVDDICTTGATLAACAEALHQAGATAIWGLTLGRALAPGGSEAGTGRGARPARVG